MSDHHFVASRFDFDAEALYCRCRCGFERRQPFSRHKLGEFEAWCAESDRIHAGWKAEHAAEQAAS